MHRVEPQPVEAIVAQPVKGILDDKGADLRDPKIDGAAPRRRGGGKELRRITAEVIPLRAKMIVDDVEKDHQVALMRGVDQSLEILRPPIRAIGGKEKNAVVA